MAIPWLPEKVARRALRPAARERAAASDPGRRRTAARVTLDVTIITGMSGAGRSAAADVLEDLGFFVIDNLPPTLVAKVAELGRGAEGAERFALVIDVRSGEFVDDLVAALAELREMGASTRVLFLDAADDVLVRRYEATRRKHPLADRRARLRRHRQRAAAARGLEGPGRHRGRHQRAQRARAARPPPRAVRRRPACRRAADQHRVVRLQARTAHRRRSRVRLPVPAQPALGRRPPPVAGHRSARPRLRPAAGRDRPVPRRVGTLVRAAAPGLRARGQVVPLDRDRLHRGSPPQRGDRHRARRRLLQSHGVSPNVHHRDVDRG